MGDLITPVRMNRPAVRAKARVLRATPWRVISTYVYYDEQGRELFFVERRERTAHYDDSSILGNREKDFRQYRCDARGKKLYGLGEVRRVLYELPSVLWAMRNDGAVWVVEGERDADRLNDLFRHELGTHDRATTAPMGAGKWRTEFSESLRGANVVICGDADPAGRAHVEAVRRSLSGIAATVRVLDAEALFGEVRHG